MLSPCSRPYSKVTFNHIHKTKNTDDCNDDERANISFSGSEKFRAGLVLIRWADEKWRTPSGPFWGGDVALMRISFCVTYAFSYCKYIYLWCHMGMSWALDMSRVLLFTWPDLIPISKSHSQIRASFALRFLSIKKPNVLLCNYIAQVKRTRNKFIYNP